MKPNYKHFVVMSGDLYFSVPSFENKDLFSSNIEDSEVYSTQEYPFHFYSPEDWLERHRKRITESFDDMQKLYDGESEWHKERRERSIKEYEFFLKAKIVPVTIKVTRVSRKKVKG